MRKRILAAALATIMTTASFFSGLGTQNVYAAEKDSTTTTDASEEETSEDEDVINESDDVFDQLGFDTSELPEGYDEDSPDNPNGSEYTTMLSIGEAFVVADDKSQLLGHDNKLDDNFDTFFSTSQTNDGSVAKESGSYRAATSGCFDGKGRNSDLAVVSLDKNGSLTLSVTGKNDNFKQNDFITVKSPVNVASGLNKQSFVEITTGDYNNDGLDEIAVMAPQATSSDSNAKVMVYKLRGKDLSPYKASNWTMVWSYALPKSSTYWNHYDLCTTDVNKDGTDDLIVTWGKAVMTTAASNVSANDSANAKLKADESTESTSMLLFGGKTKMLQTSQKISYGNDPLCRVSFTVGDINGDNANEIVMGGQLLNEATQCNKTRCLAVYKYDADKKNIITTNVYNMAVVEDGNGYDKQYLSMPELKANIAVASKFYGAGNDNCVYLDSVLYSYKDTFKIVDEIDDDKTRNAAGIEISHPFHGSLTYSEYNANGSQFAGGAASGLMLERIHAGSFYHTDMIYAKYPTGKNPDKKDDLSIVNKVISSNNNGSPNGLFAAVVDTDLDGAVMRYTGNHFFAYTDPKVLSVMAAAPYYKDVAENADGGDDMVSSCETSWGKSTGSGHYEGHEYSYDIGYYHENTFSLLGGELTWYQGVGGSFGYNLSETNSTDFTITYASIPGKDSVALFSIPESIYEYEIEYTDVDADGNNVTKTKKTQINVPYQPVTQTISLEKYNKIQKNNPGVLPVISGKAITSTPGDPSSYPSSTNGYNAATEYQGDWAGTAYEDGGSVSQEISSSYEKDDGSYGGWYLSITLAAGSSDHKFGASFDGSWVHTSGDITSSGTTASGTVANMPEEMEQYGYYYAWKLMTYQYQVSDGYTFPVVTYLTRDVTQPPKLPEDFSQDHETTTDTQIGLSWTYDKDVSSFDIFRKSKFADGDEGVKVGTVKASDYTLKKDAKGELVYENGKTVKEYSFIEKNLSPYTDYEYSLQVNRSKIPPKSLPTKYLKARTNAKYQPELKISDEELTVYPDTVKTVTARALDSEEFTYNNKSWQWQKYDEETDSWEDLPGQTKTTYKFLNCTDEDEGEYRCRLNTEITANDSVFNITAYTETLTVTYSKRDVQFGDVTYTENKDKTTFTIGITNCGDGAKSQPSGNILFTLSDGQNERMLRADIDVSTNTASVTFDSMENGAYELSTQYLGNNIFRGAVNENPYIYMKGITSSTWISSAKEYPYHENIMDTLKLYRLEQGDNFKTKKTEINDQITKIEICNPSTKEAYASFDIDDDHQIAFIPTGENCALNKVLLKIYYGEDKPVEKTVSTKKASLTLYLDDKEVDSIDELGKIGLNDIKVKGDGYEDGDNPFTFAEDHEIDPSIPDIFRDESSHFNVGLYTVTDQIIGNIMDTTASGETKINPDDISAGKYNMKVRYGADYDNWTELSKFYSISLDPASFIFYGDTYNIHVSAAKDNDKTVGSVSLVSPDKQENVTEMKYQGGTTLTLKAVPIPNYYVKCWEIKENGQTKIVPATSDKLNYLVQGTDQDISIKAVFTMTENHFTYKAIGGGTVTCTNGSLNEDSIVVSGRELAFTAKANPGYEFVEWRKVTVGKSTVVSKGTITNNGTVSTNSFVMGDASIVLYAVFQRQKASISLGDHLIAYYINSSDIDSNVPEGLELKVNNENLVAKGATVIVRPEPGYKAANWNVSGIDNYDLVEAETGIQFVVPDDVDEIAVNADVTAGIYALSIQSADDTSDISIKLDGKDITDEKALKHVTCGTTLELKATPHRGYVFDHWKVNNKVVEGNSLSYAANVIKNMTIVAVCKALPSYTVDTQLQPPINEEKVTAEVFNSYGDLVETINLSKSWNTYKKITIYEGDSIRYSLTNGRINKITLDDVEVSSVDNVYELKKPDKNSKIDFYFMPSIYYKVNIQNDTKFTLYDRDETTEITDCVYVGAEEYYPIIIDTNSGVNVYLNGKKLEISGNRINLKEITGESTLLITTVETYHIYNEDDLIQYYRALEEVDRKNTKPVNAILEEDITIQSSVWDTREQLVYLSGTFDGNGHTIYNFNTNKTKYSGLFSIIIWGSCVKDLRLVGCNFLSKSNMPLGAIATINEGTIENCSVENCVIQTDPENTQKSAGIAQTNLGTIRNCLVNNCSVDTNYMITYTNTSGGLIENCFVNQTAYTKGFKDLVCANNGIIKNCYYYYPTKIPEETFGTNIWNNMSSGEAAYTLNKINDDTVWGIYDTNAYHPVLMNLDNGQEKETKAPVLVRFTGYKDFYIYPGTITIPTYSAANQPAWTDGKATYQAGKETDEILSDTTFTAIDTKNTYIVTVNVDNKISYFKTLEEALAYANKLAVNIPTVTINKDISLTKTAVVEKHVKLRLGENSNREKITLTIEDGASLTNKGNIDLFEGDVIYNYGSFKNAETGRLYLHGNFGPDGTFINSGSFANAGIVTNQNYMQCAPHSGELTWKTTKEASTTEEGLKEGFCPVCLQKVEEEVIPKKEEEPAPGDDPVLTKLSITGPKETVYVVNKDGNTAFNASGITATAVYSDGTSKNVSNLTYVINGEAIKNGEDLEAFLDKNKICDKTFKLGVKAYDFTEIAGAEAEFDLTISGSAVGHQYSFVAAVEATTTSNGNIAHYTCDRCKKYFSATSKTEITKEDVVITKESVIEKEEEAKKIISVVAGEKEEKFKTLEEALTYANENAPATVTVNKDISLDKNATIGENVTLTLNSTNKAKLTIEHEATLMNKGTISLPKDTMLTNKGSFKNATGATVNIGTEESPAGLFMNSGSFSNAGSFSDQTLIQCAPHSENITWTTTKEATEEETGLKEASCPVCLHKVDEKEIPKKESGQEETTPVLESLEIHGPSKTSYTINKGEKVAFSADGVSVIAHYSDNSSKPINNLDLSINGKPIKDGDDLETFLNRSKDCGSTFSIKVEAYDFAEVDQFVSSGGAAHTFDLELTGTAVGHQYRLVEAVDATTTEDGNIAHYICDRCGKYFTADDKTETTKKAVTIPKETEIEKEEAAKRIVIVKAAETENSFKTLEEALAYANEQAPATVMVSRNAVLTGKVVVEKGVTLTFNKNNKPELLIKNGASLTNNGTIVIPEGTGITNQGIYKNLAGSTLDIGTSAEPAGTFTNSSTFSNAGSVSDQTLIQCAPHSENVIWKISTESTTEATGLKEAFCSVCLHKVDEKEIPKKDVDPDEEAKKKAEEEAKKKAEEEAKKKAAEEAAKKAAEEAAKKAAEEKALQDVIAQYNIDAATLAVTESVLTNRTTDADINGSAYSKLALSTKKTAKNSITIKWNAIAGADGYIIFGNLCGNKYKLKKLKEVSGTTTSFTQLKLKPGKFYKYTVLAYKLVNGNKVTISVSKAIHEATKGGKSGSITGITVKKVGTAKSVKISLAVNKTAKITAVEKKSKKVPRHRKLGYESSNKAIATVSATGVIKAVAAGQCTIYIYTQNGKTSKITVTVK